MMDDYKLDGDSQGERIRALFKEHGNGESLRRFTQRCIDFDLFDDIQLDGFRIVGAMKAVKSAIKQDDDQGIPFAFNTTKKNGGGGIWKQSELLDYNEACFVLQVNYIDKEAHHHARMVNFQVWMKRRFGTAPSIPQLVY